MAWDDLVDGLDRFLGGQVAKIHDMAHDRIRFRKVQSRGDQWHPLALWLFGVEGEKFDHSLSCGHKSIAIEKQALLNVLNRLLFGKLPGCFDGNRRRARIGITNDLQAGQLFIKIQDFPDRVVWKLH